VNNHKQVYGTSLRQCTLGVNRNLEIYYKTGVQAKIYVIKLAKVGTG